MTLLDSIIGWVAPVAGLRRARARIQLNQVRRYDAAAAGRRTDHWIARGLSANAEIGVALPKLRDRSRELARNNPWAARAKQAIVSNTVGYGITAKVAGNDQFASRWKQWAGTTQCDADGRHDLNGLQALILGTVVESGECIVRRRVRRLEDGLAIPMQLQVLEPDYLDPRTEQLKGGGWITQGVQFSPFGKREGYWLYSDHPGDQMMRSSESKFVPASEVVHVFRVDRPGQARGVPWAAPAMLTLRDLDDYEDAYLFRQKLANCQVGVVEDSRDFGAGDIPPPGVAQPALGETMEPGRYDFLPSGKTIKFNTPPDAGDYGPYTRDVLLRVAAAYGITFQALTGDLSRVNFSSGRMGWIEFGRNIEAWRWQMLIPQACDPIAQWAIETAKLAGMSAQGVTVTWTPPRREMIDPTREVPALKDAVRAGFTPLSEVHRQFGEDSAEILAQYAADNAALDKLELVFDSDPRKVADSGKAQTPQFDDVQETP